MTSFLRATGVACAFVVVAGVAESQHIGNAADRFDAAARIWLEIDPDLAYAPGRILVQFESDAPQGFRQEARGLVRTAAVRSFSGAPGLERLDVDMDVSRAIELLSMLPFIEFAEPDYVLRPTATPNDQFYPLQWGMHNTGQDIRGTLGTEDADIDAKEAWDIATGDASFVIAVIDTGTQWNHPDLDDNIWSNPGEIANNGIDDDGNGYVDDIRGWDFYDSDNNPDDESGHGSHTSGTVGAEGNNGIGVAGVMWDCQIMPLRFLGPFGGFTSDAIAAVNYAADKGVKVSNNSWGGGGFSSGLYNAINNAKSVGHLFVAAAGNDGVNTDGSPHYPSSYDLDNILSVASVDYRDNLASDSNYGAASVDLGAPGVDIASTYFDSSYVWSSGTSMASPHVAGVAALVYSQNPGWTYQQVVARILDTVRPMNALQGMTATGGMVNAYGALTGDVPPGDPEPPAAPSGTGAADNADGSATITWSDNSSDEDGFEIQRQKQKRNGNWVGTSIVASVGADVEAHVDASGKGTFRYRARSFNQGGESAWNAWAEVTVTGGGGGGGGGNGGGGNGGGGGGNGNGNGNGGGG